MSADLADDVECADPLSVEAHVLGVGLREAEVVAVLDELAHGERVAVNVTGGEALKEEGENGRIVFR